LCYRFAGNHEDAADLAQDVFVRAFRGLARFKGQSAFKTWLYRVGVNTCLKPDAAKRPASEPLDDQAHVGPSGESIRSSRSSTRSEPCGSRRAVEQLPPKQRATLVLRIYEGLSHEEIARISWQHRGCCQSQPLSRAREPEAFGESVSTHLTPAEVVSVADGHGSEVLLRHVETCSTCHAQVDAVRAVEIDLRANSGVPEPSPLFWDHFSARVRQATSDEPVPATSWWPGRWVAVAAAGAAVVALAVMISIRWPGRPVAPSMSDEARSAVSTATPEATRDDGTTWSRWQRSCPLMM
jgi:RNA polymerase sigma-70 factor (ECF subfamily)